MAKKKAAIHNRMTANQFHKRFSYADKIATDPLFNPPLVKGAAIGGGVARMGGEIRSERMAP